MIKQICLKAKVIDGERSVGSKGEVVRWHQKRCNEIFSHRNKEDGKYGKNNRTETIELQKQLNLKIDGIVGYNTIQAEYFPSFLLQKQYKI